MLQSLKTRNTIDLFWILFRTDFKLKYNDSILGFLWVLIKPFLTFFILYYVLTQVFPSGIENFAIYLLIGNIFYTFWAEGTNQGIDSILSKASLITKVNFPRYIILFSSTALSVVNFLINSLILFFFIFLNNIHPNLIQVFWYFISGFILYFCIITISMFTSIAYVRFRDLKQIWELFSQLLFWVTPVFYSYEIFINKGNFLETIIFWINPVSVTLISARSAVMYLNIEYQLNIIILLLFSIVMFIFGYFFYRKAIKKIAEYI